MDSKRTGERGAELWLWCWSRQRRSIAGLPRLMVTLHGSWIWILKSLLIRLSNLLQRAFSHGAKSSVNSTTNQPPSRMQRREEWERLSRGKSESSQKNHRRRLWRRSYGKLWTTAAADEISVDAANAAVLPELNGIFMWSQSCHDQLVQQATVSINGIALPSSVEEPHNEMGGERKWAEHAQKKAMCRANTATGKRWKCRRIEQLSCYTHFKLRRAVS